MSGYSLLNQTKVLKLLEINKILTSSLDIETVLRNLVEAAEELIEVSDTVILYLYDSDDNALKIADGVGVNIDVMKNIRFKPGESLTGKVFSDKESQLFAHEEEIQKSMSSMSEENYQYYFEGVYRRKIRSAFCVPLLYKKKCLGVLVVDNFENDGIFTYDDMKVIEVIADQSAIAIENSNLYQILKKKNDQLEHSLEIHKKFTQVILDGGGINQITSVLSNIINSRVEFKNQIEDDQKLYPIARRNEILGYLQLEKDYSELSSLEKVAVEHASTAMALELVKINALYEKELHFREEIFNQILEGVPSSELNQILEHMNWKTEWDMACMVIQGRNGPLWETSQIKDKEWFIRSIESISHSICDHCLVFTRAFQTVLIIPIVKSESVVARIANTIDNQWGYLKDMIYGIGRKVPISQLNLSYREALNAIQYGKSVQHKKVIEYSRLGLERLLHKLDRSSLTYFVEDKMGKLLHQYPELFETLGNFIETNKNHKLTAERMHIHPNTLYHRLKKIEQILDISLSHESDWIDLVVAYKICVEYHNK
ncbi:sugar diacid utilization regulator [Melghiribacillus thermohalophilus]|uniref:Sugar diacid utilization regulator n=1 Tax=Melghiribacillus thermohalophilus TaxID=1324956 RepID=A0A4R3NGQ7_9BACI|nr:helix-turn-helix domain-containing protein [Melghiribacillus thermohalophilus]TCT26493.1 sugar diacid utilization regulator [Melghiribacillus thermohalophilus]